MRKIFGARHLSVAALAAVVLTAALGMSPLMADPPGMGSMGVGGNTPPNITNFMAVQGPGNVWTFTGHVTDNENVQGWTVTITGNNFTTTAIVDGNGNFSVAEPLIAGGVNSGFVAATVTDGGGLSDTEYTYIDS
jgi:hypothetical protein